MTMGKKNDNIKSVIPVKILKDDMKDIAESIVNTVREPLLILDKDLRVVTASRSFFKFFKVSPEVTIGELIYNLGNGQWDIPKLRELLETIIPQKTTFDDFEVEHNFSTIGKRIMLLNARQVEWAFGKEKIILLAIEDITKGRLAKKEISETNRLTNEYLDILFNDAHVPIIIWDSNSVITSYNHAFEELIGYKLENETNVKLEDLFPKDNIDDSLRIIKDNLRLSNSEIIELNLLTKDKTIKTVLWASTNIYDKGGENIVATIAQDITHRKKTETELSILETRYRRLFEVTQDGILILDAETGKIIDVNPFLIDLLGYSKEKFVEKEIWDLGFFKDIAANKEKFFELQKNKYVRYDNLPLETSDGRKINVEFVSNVYLVNQHYVFQCNIRDVTKRVLAENNLKVSENRMRTLLQTIPDLIWLKDVYGRYLLCNTMFERFFGSKEIDIIGKTDFDFVDHKVAMFFRKNDLFAMRASKPTINEEWITYADDGHQAYLETIKAPMYDHQNNIIGILGIGRDITERNQSLQKINESEIRFRTIFNQAPIGIALVDIQGNITISNDPLSNLLGYSCDELSKMNFIDFTFPDDITKDTDLFTDLIEGKISCYNLEKRYIHKNGNLVWVNIFVSMMFDEQGKPRETLGMAVDITDRKKAEEQLVMLAHSLKSINECVCITDVESKIIFVNESFLKTYGYTNNELIGQNISIVRSQNNPEEVINHILPSTMMGEWRGELWNKRKDGSEFLISLSTTIVKDSEEKIIGLIGIAQDITELKLAENVLIEAKERAEQSDKLKSEFLSQISHEIRTPLNAIVGNTDYLNTVFSENKDNNIIDSFTSILIASDRIIRTVDLILNMSEYKTSGYKPEFTEVDLNLDILQKLHTNHKLEAEFKGLEFLYHCELKKRSVLADEYSLTQIFIHLIDNAIKYTKNGKVEILIAEHKTGKIMVEVKDTGIGISEKHLPRLFEPFRQEEQGYSRRFDGNGLGLSLVKSYCDINKIIIEVESKKNIGSIFRIIFNENV
ncbi:MAG: PAS domain S-box protein [Ignavibacteria bacterium]|nr:PAS domain S-box protein [Ignavibacteria bacterium]